MACATFSGIAGLSTMTATLNQSFMMVMTSMAAMVAGIIFWGYGFDQIRQMSMRVWYVKALVALLFVLLNHLGYLLPLNTFTVCLCNLTGTGGQLYFAAWMLFHSDASEMATASAVFTLIGVSNFLM